MKLHDPKNLISKSSFMDVYLVICTCTYIKSIWPSLFDKYKTGAMGSFWKCARICERLSPYVAFGCLAMAFQILFITWISKMKINYLQSHQRLQKCVFRSFVKGYSPRYLFCIFFLIVDLRERGTLLQQKNGPNKSQAQKI